MEPLEVFADAFEEVGDKFVQDIGNMFNFAGAGGLTSGQFTVNPGNVMAAAKIISSQAEALDVLHWDCRDRLSIDPPGGDEISKRMVDAWNDLLVSNEDSYSNRVDQYVVSLRSLVTQIEGAARSYGYTDEQIAAALGKTTSA